MAFDDFVEPEVAIAVAVTAAVASPPVRKAMRRGLVYGLAGLLVAKDKITTTAHEIAHKAQETASPHNNNSSPETSQAPPTPHVLTA